MDSHQRQLEKEATVPRDHILIRRRATEPSCRGHQRVELVMLYVLADQQESVLLIRLCIPALDPALLSERKVSMEKMEKDPLLLERLWDVMLRCHVQVVSSSMKRRWLLWDATCIAGVWAMIKFGPAEAVTTQYKHSW